MARCWSCNKPAKQREDYCYGCRHVVCYPCTQIYDHAGNGSHGRKQTKDKKVKPTVLRGEEER